MGVSKENEKKAIRYQRGKEDDPDEISESIQSMLVTVSLTKDVDRMEVFYHNRDGLDIWCLPVELDHLRDKRWFCDGIFFLFLNNFH